MFPKSNLLKTLVELLDKSLDDPEVQKFLKEYTEIPERNETFSMFELAFPRSGFALTGNKNPDTIFAIELYFGDKNGWGDYYKEWKPFKNELLLGLNSADSRSSVYRKFGCMPISREEVWSPLRRPEMPQISSRKEAQAFWKEQDKLQEERPHDADSDSYLYESLTVVCVFSRARDKLVIVRLSKHLKEVGRFID